MIFDILKMLKKYPEGKGKTKITATIDNTVNEQFEKYIEETGVYNKSALVEELIKKQIIEDKKKK